MTNNRAALVSLMLLVAVACGAEEEPGAGDPSTTSPTGFTTTEASGDAVTTGSTDLGVVLVDGDGFTLYVFAIDEDSVSNCVDACATTWPPVDGSLAGGAGTDPGSFTSIDRPDGTTQLAINGKPLYRFAGDTAPGDVNGHGVEDVWFAVGADGEPVSDSTGSGLAPDDYGYDY
jgi:predicted lipoprotein with Yx(FWY)xxD motif